MLIQPNRQRTKVRVRFRPWPCVGEPTVPNRCRSRDASWRAVWMGLVSSRRLLITERMAEAKLGCRKTACPAQPGPAPEPDRIADAARVPIRTTRPANSARSFADPSRRGMPNPHSIRIRCQSGPIQPSALRWSRGWSCQFACSSVNDRFVSQIPFLGGIGRLCPSDLRIRDPVAATCRPSGVSRRMPTSGICRSREGPRPGFTSRRLKHRSPPGGLRRRDGDPGRFAPVSSTPRPPFRRCP